MPPLGSNPDAQGVPLEPRLGRVAQACEGGALRALGFESAALAWGGEGRIPHLGAAEELYPPLDEDVDEAVEHQRLSPVSDGWNGW